MSTLSFNELLASIAERGRHLVHLEKHGRHAAHDPGELADALLSGRGEASGVAIARALLDTFEALDAKGKSRFFHELIVRFGPDHARLEAAIEAYRAAPDDATRSELHDAAEPRRQELIRRLNLAPGGTAALVAMRTEVLDRLREEPELTALDHDFDHLLSSWFNRGFLTLKHIDWHTPAAILEKIIRYEAVHRIDDWDDLHRRIAPPDRRCYAFFHPALVDEPLIFVEVALMRDTARAIAPVLANDRAPIAPGDAVAAVFYSISNCQRGLRGVSFGSFLIKQVVADLTRDLPGLKTFVTLSPVPGLRAWLRGALADDTLSFLDDQARDALAALDSPDWARDTGRAGALQQLLPPLTAYYLMHAKTASGKPLDGVARFHLGNGARLERVNWLGDSSRKGMEQAGGIMVNYQYRLKDIEKNHEAFANSGKVSVSKPVRSLLDALPVGDAHE